MAKKIWELMQEDIERNKQASENLQKEANEKFNNLVSKKGEYDTSKHTSNVKNITNAYRQTSKASANNFKKANRLTLWDTIKQTANDTGKIAQNTWLGLENGVKSFQQTLGRAITNTQADRMGFWNEQDKEILNSIAKNNPEKAEAINKAIENPLFSGDKIREESNKVTQRIKEEKDKNTEKIQENANSIKNPVGKYLAGDIMPTIGQMAPGLIGGATYFIGSATGNYYDDAKQRGMNEDEATIYSGTMGIIEGSLEALGAKLTTNVGKNLLKKNIKSALVNYGLDIGENFLEEAIVEPVSELVAQTTAGKDKANWENIGQRFLQSGIDGAVVSMITGGVSGLAGGVASNFQNNKYTDINTGETLNKESQNWLKEAENIINSNNTSNLQQESTQTKQILPKKQISQEQNNIAQNENMEQVVKKNIINEKVNEYINKNRSNFNSKINLSTEVVNKTNGAPINYKVQNQGTIYKKARELFSTINKKVFKNSNQDIYVTNGDIRESIEKTLKNPEQRKQINENLAVFSQLDKIIENGQKISSSELDNKGRNEYGNYEYYVSNAFIDGKPYVVEFDTRLQSGEGRKQERHFRLERVYNINEVGSKTGATEVTNQIDIEPTSIITNSISQNTKNVNRNDTYNYSTPIEEKYSLPTNKTLNPTEISNITIGDVDTTPTLQTKNYERGNKQSSFFSNIVTDAKFLENDLRQEIGKDENIRYYKGITNQETLEKAYRSLNGEGKNATLNWFNKDSKDISAEDVAKGWILLKQYQDNGDYQGAVEVAKKMRDMGTKAGQAVQAYNILSRLTPEGMFYYAQSELNEAYNKMVQGKSQKWIEENQSKFDLTPEETQFIMDNMNEVAEMEDGYDKKVKLAEIQKIITDKIPPTAGQSIKAWMRISMLFNPKTQVRNVMGNAIIMPVNMFSDSVSAGIDKIIAKKTGVRTTGNTNLKNYGKGFKKGVYESYNDFRKDINTRNIEGNRFEVNEGKSFKDKGIGKALNRVDNMLSFALDSGDRGFYEATFTNSINNQLVLNNTTQATQDMVDIATTEALQRTWQDNNKYTEAVLKIRKILNSVNVKGYGLGDVLIPFAKTPANLTKAIIDYSPVGLVKTMTLDAKTFKNSLENGQFTPQMQHKFVQNLGKGMAGSFLYVLGYALAKAGVASGEADDDKDVKNFMKNSLGISSYSLKIGNKTFTYDWAQPVATPLAIMTNYVKYSKDNPDANILEKVIKSLNIGTEQLLQQSFMESLNTVLNGNGTTLENLSQAVLDLPARAIPTFSKQIADMVDGTQRTSFEYGRPVKSAVNSVIAKIPVASKTLPVSRDTLGNEIKKYGGENNIWNVMFNPANVNKGELSKAGEEIYRLYQETGETTVFPITAPYYINSSGEKITMTSEERSNYQKATGKYTEKSIEELLSNRAYKELSNDKKAELITDIISDSNAKAKHDILGIETEESKKKRELIEKVGMKNYYDYRLKTKDIEGQNASLRKNEVLLNANYSSSAKEVLYVNTTGKEDEIYNILKDIDIDEYLDYKIKESKEEFSADKDSNGNSISGTSKKKYYNYINSNISDAGSRLIILGSKYKLSNSERYQLSDYINKISSNNEEAIQTFEYLSKNYVVKGGKVYYK